MCGEERGAGAPVVREASESGSWNGSRDREGLQILLHCVLEGRRKGVSQEGAKQPGINSKTGKGQVLE